MASKKPALVWNDHLPLAARLRRLQVLLPIGIIAAVSTYAGLFELLLPESVTPWQHFGLEFLIFGIFGAAVTWVTLEWVRRVVAARERAEAEIYELNRRLEARVAQRTRELAEANRELRKRQYELETANAELERLDELKSEFVSLVSHELRAPLSNISGSLELLLGDAPLLSENQRELVTLANEQAARLARLVKSILNVSRIEAGQTVLQLQAFDARALLEGMLAQWQSCDPERRYLLDAPANLPSVWADRDKLEEVLTNLLDNAYKYSEPGTDITVHLHAEGDSMLIAVQDCGKGIEPSELDKIFDKFYRVEQSDARLTYGHGLGLYISVKLVEAMGGELRAESRVDHGSTFFVSLPLAGHTLPARPALAAN